MLHDMNSMDQQSDCVYDCSEFQSASLVSVFVLLVKTQPEAPKRKYIVKFITGELFDIIILQTNFPYIFHHVAGYTLLFS